MITYTKFAIIVLTLFLCLLVFIGIWFVLYGLPQVRSHSITLHNVREDKASVSYQILGEWKTLSYGDHVNVTIPNNTSITAKSVSGTEIQTQLVWSSSINYTDIYFFIESIESNLTTVNLQVTNDSEGKYWIWIWPSQIKAAVHNIPKGKNVSIYTYIGQNLAFSQSSELDESNIYFFSVTSLSINKITLGDSGIITSQI